MLMAVRMAHPLPLIILIMIHDLQVESPERVTEGDSVRLTCKSSCTLTDRATFIWYRNSQPLTERRDTNNELLLQPVRREDAGRYSCALHGHTYISPDVHLNVTYAPKSVSVSISPSGEIVEGDSVTLICSSDSNPPAEISWFKGRTFVGSGRIYSISNISSDHSREYKCKSINEHGEKYSDAVTLNVMYTPKKCSVSINGSGEIVEGDSVTLNCSSDSNPPANISWFKGGIFVGSGRIYSITKISSDHSGEYKCKSINELGEKDSDAVTLNVLYPPKKCSVSINGSGEIVEGDSVSLSCSSDSNPPAEISWFKGGTFVGSGRNYSISNISSDHSGEYKCKSRNKHGENYSDAVILNVMYPPKKCSVSINGSAEIVEGNSVTLSCSSDSNPPAEISWFKGGTFVGSGRIYSVSKISSDHSGEYKCKSINELGEKDSDAVTLNVMYPPNKCSVSINGSAEIEEGDSVTLICSSDSNPPPEILWYKEGESSSVGSEQSFSARQSGRFYCDAHNRHGSQKSNVVTVIVQGRTPLYAATGVIGGLGGLISIFIIVLLMRRTHRADDITQKQDDLYVNVSAHHGPLSESHSANQNDALYSLITVNNFSGNQTEGKASDSEDTEEIQYAAILHRNKETNQPEEKESLYGNIGKHQPDAAMRSDQTVEDQSVIYSTVK
ncbi:hypothetical protein QQF64_000136 [Cirrhinus molitorella]|uniref:Ig-like domain-containing protein n=1 Tax=Cirrhinus molitorella TaxID=172907 RepID=A0ABR3NXA2_9TELE